MAEARFERERSHSYDESFLHRSADAEFQVLSSAPTSRSVAREAPAAMYRTNFGKQGVYRPPAREMSPMARIKNDNDDAYHQQHRWEQQQPPERRSPVVDPLSNGTNNRTQPPPHQKKQFHQRLEETFPSESRRRDTGTVDEVDDDDDSASAVFNPRRVDRRSRDESVRAVPTEPRRTHTKLQQRSMYASPTAAVRGRTQTAVRQASGRAIAAAADLWTQEEAPPPATVVRQSSRRQKSQDVPRPFDERTASDRSRPFDERSSGPATAFSGSVPFDERSSLYLHTTPPRVSKSLRQRWPPPSSPSSDGLESTSCSSDGAPTPSPKRQSALRKNYPSAAPAATYGFHSSSSNRRGVQPHSLHDTSMTSASDAVCSTDEDSLFDFAQAKKKNQSASDTSHDPHRPSAMHWTAGAWQEVDEEAEREMEETDADTGVMDASDSDMVSQDEIPPPILSRGNRTSSQVVVTTPLRRSSPSPVMLSPKPTLSVGTPATRVQQPESSTTPNVAQSSPSVSFGKGDSIQYYTPHPREHSQGGGLATRDEYEGYDKDEDFDTTTTNSSSPKRNKRGTSRGGESESRLEDRSLTSWYTKSAESEVEDVFKDIFLIGDSRASRPGRRLVRDNPAVQQEQQFAQKQRSTPKSRSAGPKSPRTVTPVDEERTTETVDEDATDLGFGQGAASAIAADPLQSIWNYFVAPSEDETQPEKTEAVAKSRRRRRRSEPPSSDDESEGADTGIAKSLRSNDSVTSEQPKSGKLLSCPNGVGTKDDEGFDFFTFASQLFLGDDDRDPKRSCSMNYADDDDGDGDSVSEQSGGANRRQSRGVIDAAPSLEEDHRLVELASEAAKSVHRIRGYEYDESHKIDFPSDMKFSVVNLEMPLGLIFQENEIGCWVTKVLPSGSACANGRVLIGDQLAAIDGASAIHMKVNEIAGVIKEKGGTVELTFLRYVGPLHPTIGSVTEEGYEVKNKRGLFRQSSVKEKNKKKNAKNKQGQQQGKRRFRLFGKKN